MKKTRLIGIISIITMLAMLMSVCVHAATTTEILGGSITITDSVGTGTGNESQYTITVKGGLLSTKKNSITIANTSGVDGEISFNYTVSNANACTIAGSSVSGTGDHSSVVNAGSSIAIDLTAPGGLKTATLTLTNISLKTAASAEITYEYDSALGSVVAVTTDSTTGETVETAVASGDIVTVGSEGVTMVATPKSGVVFHGWIDESGKIVSTLSSYTQIAVGNNTITAVFSDGTIPYFMTDEKYIFSDLNDAISAGTNTVLICNGTLPKGNYTIPTGKTLLIPMDSSNTIYTNVPPSDQASSYKKPTLYRKLTLANGVNITVNGVISIGGKLSASQGSHGSLIGTYGQIDMNSGSTITVNNGAKLYSWGYITGAGSVTAKSGATVYEPFQVRDWRGGDATTSMLNNTQRVFPMSQYYVQNIEVPLTLEAGAIENGFMAVYVTLAGIQTSEVPFIGPSGMFRIVSGSVTKDYDENTDRLVIDVNNGTLEMATLTLSMKISAFGGSSTIDSSKYTLPVNGNITLRINDGSTVNVSQEMALLPGGEIYVYEGATCNFVSGTKAFIYDSTEWGAYCAHTNKTLMPANHAPGRKYTRTDADLKDALVYVEGEVNASAGFAYTTASGANICGAEDGLVKMQHGTDTLTYQVTQSNTDISVWNEIPVTTAWLKNADETYVDPETLGDCGKQFTYTDGVWEPTHTNVVTVPGTAATCIATGLTDGIKCDACGTVIKEQTTIPVTDHTWDTGVITTPATHTAEGVKTYTCTICGETKTETIPADTDNHSYTESITKAATCEEAGVKTYSCECGDSYTEEIAALGHSWDAGVITTEPTHTTDGVKTYTCATCGGTKTETIPADADNHTYTESITKAATCEEAGVKTFSCECGDSYTEEIAALGHSWGAGVITTPATHTAEGVKTYTCGNCGATKTETIPADADNHSYTESITKAATCEEAGVKTYSCECGDSYTEEIAALGHSWDAGVITTEPTHTAEGVKTFTCGNCGDTYTETIEKTADHNYGEWVKVDEVNHSRECECGSVETKSHEFDGFACSLCGCDKIVTKTSYVIENGQIKTNTELVWDVPEGTQIIVALYTTAGKLVNATISSEAELAEIACASSDVAKIRVFAWSGLDLLKPISILEEITIK